MKLNFEVLKNHFLKELNKIFQVHFAKTVISRKHRKLAIFDNLMTITLGVNKITRQMTKFFSSNL